MAHGPIFSPMNKAIRLLTGQAEYPTAEFKAAKGANAL
jgi:hypothetical protein